jgi:hypothetical protein
MILPTHQLRLPRMRRYFSMSSTGRVLVLLVAASSTARASVVPDPLPVTRYEKMINKSFFAPATPVAPAAAPSFTANLYVTSVAKIADKDFVTIAKQGDPQSKFSLYGNDQSDGGIQLVSVEWSEQIGKTKVTIKKGTEFGVLEFDQATVQKPLQVTPQPGPMVPGQAPVRPNFSRPPNLVPQPIPQPGAPTEPRRRRIINTKP